MSGITTLDGREIIWQPLPKQKLAMECPAFELLYGGSKGGAKTNFLVTCITPILHLAHQKWLTTGKSMRTVRNMVFRKNQNDLKDFIAKSFEVYPYLDPEMGMDGWHEKDKYWRFTSGATVEMNHLDGPRDHESFNGQEFASLLMDEVQFIPFEQYLYLFMQVRSKDPDIAKLNMVRCTANPGGPYGDWVKKHFHVDECPDGGRVFSHKVMVKGKERETTRAFLRSYLRDNPHLDADGSYEARLRANMNADEVRMYMDGDFDCVAGAFFSHLLRPQVHFVKSFSIPGSWDMIHSSDWGSSAPACTLVGARDNDNTVYVIDELHQPGITGRVYGEAMKGMWQRQKWSRDRVWKVDDFWGVIDTQAMHEYNGPATPAAGIMEHGFRLYGADKLPGEREVGINQLKERLLLNRMEKPQLVIFEDRCPNLVRAIKGIESLAPIEPDNYNPKSPLAHAIDTLRFMLMKWPVEPRDDRNPVDVEVERWNRILNAQQKQAPESGGYQSGY